MNKLAPTLKLSKLVFKTKNVSYDYWVGGNPKGQTVIFIHGLTGSHEGLMPLAEQMQEFNVVMIDLPGHGNQAGELEPSLKILGDWLCEFIDFINKKYKKPTVLIGHSFGGAVVARAYATFFKKIKLAILLNPVYSVGRRTRAYQQMLTMLPVALTTALDSNKFVRRLKQNYILVRRDSNISQIVAAIMGWHKPTARQTKYYLQLSDIVGHDDFYEKVIKNMPHHKMLCVQADKDRMVAAHDTQKWRTILGDDCVKVCQNTGHLMPIEAPYDTAQIIKESIKTIN